MKMVDEGVLEAPPHADSGKNPGSFTVARLFKIHAQRVARLLGRKLRNNEDAEDARQDVFLKLWRQEQAGQLRDQATAYMFAAAHTVAIDADRRRVAHGYDRTADVELEELAHPGLPTEDTQHWRDGVASLVSSLQELPARTQQVFILYHFEGLTHSDIAARLGITVRTVERNMAQAHDFCRERLKDYL